MLVRHGFRLFLKWLWLILVLSLIAGFLAFAYSLSYPPIYQASTKLLVNQAAVPSGGAAVFNPLAPDRLALTYSDWLTTRPILEETIRRLNLNEIPEGLAEEISATPILETQLLLVKVEDEDPMTAAAIANTLPQVLIEKNRQVGAASSSSTNGSLTNDLASLKEEIDKTQRQIDGLHNATPAANANETRRLQVLLVQEQGTYDLLQKSYQDVLVGGTQARDAILVVEPAAVPTDPVSPDIPFNVAVAAAIGAVLAIAIGLLGQLLDDSIRTPQHASQAVGLPFLGTIPVLNELDDKAGPTAITHARSADAQAFRELRTTIQHSSPDRPVNSVLVTSVNPGDGKSTLAANLAAVIAQDGYSVVLVDANLRHPSLHEIFRLPNRRGLSNVLAGDIDPPRAAQATSVENLLVVPSGFLPPDPPDLLDSEEMTNLIARLGQKSDLVVFDGTAALPFSDAAILASQVDAVLLVLDATRTRRPDARRAVQGLRSVGANLIGTVLNRVSSTQWQADADEMRPPIQARPRREARGVAINSATERDSAQREDWEGPSRFHEGGETDTAGREASSAQSSAQRAGVLPFEERRRRRQSGDR